ncbi:hypothetical protein, partial [Amycolatopsis pretoriensis]|uniref:hypothetical protein n=1 Tax=Amycolatopsis pretoriensis TaxID=218821 RepID=UPI002011E496
MSSSRFSAWRARGSANFEPGLKLGMMTFSLPPGRLCTTRPELALSCSYWSLAGIAWSHWPVCRPLTSA